MENISTVGFKPKMTFSNSFFEAILSLIGAFILGKVIFFLLVVSGIASGEVALDIRAALNIGSLIFAVWLTKKLVHRKLKKRHEKENS